MEDGGGQKSGNVRRTAPHHLLQFGGGKEKDAEDFVNLEVAEPSGVGS